ncbi:MAG TPA: ASPIC/UnbV domain-containing protein, partial [Acidobacteriaceae bacterium]|nr:ASPIC/UnbV domain-containing protein [Acidobacteriaceae bacterium]
VLSGGSFASNNDPRVHFGLGTNAKVDHLEIHWPDQAKESVVIPSVDRYFTIQEGRGIVKGVYDPHPLRNRTSQQHPLGSPGK